MSRICLYYLPAPEVDRWMKGDRYLRPLVRRILRGPPIPSGIDRVFLNLRLGLDRLGVRYEVNLPFDRLRPDDYVGVLGRGRRVLDGYRRSNPIVAGIALMGHPSEWPSLCSDYPVVRYLQHSQWANEIYKPYFGDKCGIWPVGIDTQDWKPSGKAKTVDFLVYDKIQWSRETKVPQLLDAATDELTTRGLTFEIIRYRDYTPKQYKAALERCRAMLFFSEHESQGIAYQECLASGVPVLAWDEGRFQSPDRATWGEAEIPASSVPFFSPACGLSFQNAGEFPERLTQFMILLDDGAFDPRSYILETLTVEKCSQDFLDILKASR